MPVGDMASVHLSISKHWQLSSLSTGGEVNPSPPPPFSPLRRPALSLSSSPPPLPPPSLSPVPFIRHPPSTFYTLPSPLSLFFFFPRAFPHLFFSFPQSPLHPSSPRPPPLLPLPYPRLSMERPIQQQKKAAYSIARWLIKQDQNSAALRSTRQHYDTAPQRQGGGFSLTWRTGGRGGWVGEGDGGGLEAARRILTRTQDNNKEKTCQGSAAERKERNNVLQRCYTELVKVTSSCIFFHGN